MNDYPVTPAGMRRLRERVVALEVRLVSITQQKGEAAEVGGNVWHDNFSFEQLQRDEAMVLRQLEEARTVLKRARVVEVPAAATDVRLGTRVRIRLDDGREQLVTIGGYGDSDPSIGVISCMAPLGRCLLGAVTGDVRQFNAGGRERRVEVLELGPSEE
ncbi:MAG: GreA/GreB family elongation factor [Chloroflexi bacterium]|nr:GreA/GreB family elongation factor [Chloroflexota bacterium]